MILVLFDISKDPERVRGTEKSLGEAAVPNNLLHHPERRPDRDRTVPA
jgi:hypothetical protein